MLLVLDRDIGAHSLNGTKPVIALTLTLTLECPHSFARRHLKLALALPLHLFDLGQVAVSLRVRCAGMSEVGHLPVAPQLEPPLFVRRVDPIALLLHIPLFHH